MANTFLDTEPEEESVILERKPLNARNVLNHFLEVEETIGVQVM